MTNQDIDNISAVILAGGMARRMKGQDKGLININGNPMISYIIDSLKDQVSEILINANRNINKYEKFGYKVFSDQLDNFQGPLAGIVEAMKITKHNHICTCPCDGPIIPHDYVSRLYSAMKLHDCEICVSHDGNRIQPVYALISCNLYANLELYLKSGERKIDRWYLQHKVIEVDFSDAKDSFINVNTPEDLQTVSHLLLN